MSYARDALGRLEALSATVEAVSTPIVSNRLYRADGRLAAQSFGNGLGETRSGQGVRVSGSGVRGSVLVL